MSSSLIVNWLYHTTDPREWYDVYHTDKKPNSKFKIQNSIQNKIQDDSYPSGFKGAGYL